MSQHQHQMFPMEFLTHIIRHFNSVIKESILVVSMNKLEIRFERAKMSDKSVVVSLFTKLVEAFKSISEKYIIERDIHTRIRLNLEDTDEFYKILVSGVIYVPPGKIFNLLSLILWYHIRYITGTKPSNSEFGRKLTQTWRDEEKHMRFEINQSSRRVNVTKSSGPCYICGEPAFKENVWEFKPHETSKSLMMRTQVCRKHTTKLI